MKQNFSGPVGQVSAGDINNYNPERGLDSYTDEELYQLESLRKERIKGIRKQMFQTKEFRLLLLILLFWIAHSSYMVWSFPKVFMTGQHFSSWSIWLSLAALIIMYLVIKPVIDRYADEIVKHKKHLKRIEEKMMDRGLR